MLFRSLVGFVVGIGERFISCALRVAAVVGGVGLGVEMYVTIFGYGNPVVWRH